MRTNQTESDANTTTAAKGKASKQDVLESIEDIVLAILVLDTQSEVIVVVMCEFNSFWLLSVSE